MARDAAGINENEATHSRCRSCQLKRFCLPANLDAAGVQQFERIVERQIVFAPGRPLYRPGETARSAFAIRAGAVKTLLLSENGDEWVIGFHLSGDVIGLETVFSGFRAYAVTTLQQTVVCQIPFTHLVRLSGRLPLLQHQLFRLLSREMRLEERLMRTIAQHNAEQRLASALLDLADRLSRAEESDPFRLPMSRADLGSHLGMAQETVSRLLRRMADKDLIRVQGRRVRIVDTAGLEELATATGRETTQRGGPSPNP